MACLPHGSVGCLPLPRNAVQCIALLDKNAPDLIQNTLPFPSLEGAVNRAVITELPGQMIPLATRASAIDDAIECLALVNSRSSRGTRRIKVVQDLGDHYPKVLWNTPKSRQ